MSSSYTILSHNFSPPPNASEQSLQSGSKVGRNICVFCDDLGKDGRNAETTKQNPTNVYRLFQLMQNTSSGSGYLSGPENRLSLLFYVPGITIGSAFNNSIGIFDQISGKTTIELIKTTYIHISHTYQEGDDIYLFGYSNGAYVVQQVASLIYHLGLDNKDRYTLLKSRIKYPITLPWSQPPRGDGEDIPIKCLAVWDAVVPLLAKWSYGNSELKFIAESRLPPNVEYAFHCLAFHENRRLFRPTLFKPNHRTELKEVWFPGTHTDVGGGGKSATGLSNISLLWVIGEMARFIEIPHSHLNYPDLTAFVISDAYGDSRHIFDKRETRQKSGFITENSVLHESLGHMRHSLAINSDLDSRQSSHQPPSYDENEQRRNRRAATEFPTEFNSHHPSGSTSPRRRGNSGPSKYSVFWSSNNYSGILGYLRGSEQESFLGSNSSSKAQSSHTVSDLETDEPSCQPLEPMWISGNMHQSEVVAHLDQHGCQDITALLDLESQNDYPVAQGGLGDVYKAKLRDGSPVAVKTTRVTVDKQDRGVKQLKLAARELHTWSKCDHRNILSLMGLVVFRGQIGMVSPWMDHGNMPHFLSRNPHWDRCYMCSQVCEGVLYLHDKGIVHGDLKGANILVSNTGIPMLTDFGSAVFKESTLHLTGSHSANGHSLRWTPPEIIRGDLSYFNKEADIYSLGMTILETISGRIPYYNKQNEATVMYAVLSGKEPPLRDEDRIPRETKHGNILWDLLVSCWQQDSQVRPSALDVMRIMGTITDAGLRPTGK